MQYDLVLFKNSPDRLLLLLDGEAAFDKIIEVIKSKVENNVSFFKGYDLVLKYKGRVLSSSEEQEICRAFTDAGATVSEISEEKIRLKKLPDKDMGNVNFTRTGAVTRKKNARTLVKNFNEESVRFFRGTVRSGQTIDFDGSVVIMGDINPGAEIMATGNIIVFGAIRGSIWAGIGGNDQAFIIGRGITPSSISISNVKTIPPEDEVEVKKGLFKTRSKKGKQETGKDLEIAYIKNGNIYIDLYDSVY